MCMYQIYKLNLNYQVNENFCFVQYMPFSITCMSKKYVVRHG